MFWVTTLITKKENLSKKLLKGANLVLQNESRKERKKETQTQIPPGGMVNRLERAYSKRSFVFISSDLQYQQIKIDALWSLLSRIQRLTTSL